MDTSGDINHAVIISGRWIYDSNLKIALHLIKEYLDLICYLSKYDYGMYEFEIFLCAVRYLNPKEKLAKAK